MTEPNKPEPTVEERSNQDSSLLETQTRQLKEVISEAPQDKPIVEQVRFLNDEVKRLRPLADDGKKHRESLIVETLKEGVRAIDGFDEEAIRKMLTDAPIENIQSMRTAYAEIGNKRFPGGRKTVDEVEQPVERSSKVMDKAYQA